MNRVRAVPEKQNGSWRVVALRSLIVAVCAGSLGWAVVGTPRSEAVDEFRLVETNLLQFASFHPTTAVAALTGATAAEITPCDTHAMRALLLLEIPLADAALRSGAVGEFDKRTDSLQSRAREILSCSPRDSFAWLILFGAATQHGKLDEHTFDLLTMSYESSPNEAWIGIRRTMLATPVVLSAPKMIQDRILTEFQNLIRDTLVEMPARAYLRASAPARALLQSRIQALDPLSQKRFSDALHQLGA